VWEPRVMRISGHTDRYVIILSILYNNLNTECRTTVSTALNSTLHE